LELRLQAANQFNRIVDEDPFMDRTALIDALARLSPSDFAIVLTLLPGGAEQVSSKGTIREQAAQLVLWAESTFGPGLQKVEEALAEIRPPDASAQRTRPCNLPFTTIGSLFKGREEFLADIRAILMGKDHRAVAVYGLGGVGKTRAALEYAWANKASYGALLFVSAPSPGELRANMAALSGVLGISTAITAVDEQLGQVLKWLEARLGWLLIIDNVDTADAASEVKKWLVRLAAGHVLITTRISNWSAGVETRQLSMLAEPDAVAFLLERTRTRPRGHDDEVQSLLVARELGCLALALEQAGAYIDKLRLTFSEYLERWRQKRSDVLRWHDDRLIEYPVSLSITWETTFGQLTPAGQRLLELVAWLAPEPIPLYCFEAPPLAAAVPEPREALAVLASFSLARYETEGVVIHPLVQEVARNRGDDVARAKSLRTALDTLDALAPSNPEDIRCWGSWALLAAHVRTSVVHADKAGIAEPTSRLMRDLGVYLDCRYQYREAEALYRRALAIDERLLGDGHPRVAVHLNNLATLLLATKRMREAEPLMRRALVIDEQSYGNSHPAVGRDLNSLALLLKATGYLSEAEPLMRRALAIDEQSFGRDHPVVAIKLNNLARLLMDTKRLLEAEPLTWRALAIDERSYGEDHPRVALQLMTVASALEAAGRLAEAETLIRRALFVVEKAYPKEHPDIATALGHLGWLLWATRRLTEAEHHLRRALQIYQEFRESTGYDHSHMDIVLRIYRKVLAAMEMSEDQIGAKLREVLEQAPQRIARMPITASPGS
jgi:tetratricopeptide (TPR) repeat protein